MHLRIGIEGGWLTDLEVRKGLAALAVGHEDWGTAWETLTKEIKLPVDLLSIFDPWRGFYGIRQKLLDDRRDAERKITDPPRWECRACWHQWTGHGKGRTCPRCGATGDVIRPM